LEPVSLRCLSFEIAANCFQAPKKVLRVGPGYDNIGDPLQILQAELSQHRVIATPTFKLPNLSGGAVGYLSYDCVRWFEPKTNRPLKDNLQIPEALFMIYDTIVAFDHFYSTLTIVTHIRLPESIFDDLQPAYDAACGVLQSIMAIIQQDKTPLPIPARKNSTKAVVEALYSSNVGRHGYESFVTNLKKHIINGDIIQAVPSQRFSRKTSVHPFNIYRTLRSTNPSPYMFYLSCAVFTIMGASPECLMKTDGYISQSLDPYSRLRIINHAIAGTIARGSTTAEDIVLAKQLQSSVKDRAEHVQLVDLARNDVNRVCDPQSVRVDRLMSVDRFSHVQHLTSEVSGVLRSGFTRWDAFRSIFPAGTVSGAPKIKAIQLVYDLEQEKRGVYAGAVGWFGYDVVCLEKIQQDGSKSLGVNPVNEGPVDTCIAIRTMLVKDGTVYLQAGGGIVYDSDETEEWLETMNKLAANLHCLEIAEKRFEGRAGVKSVQEIIEEERRK
jgi:anthranilate synthase component 1